MKIRIEFNDGFSIEGELSSKGLLSVSIKCEKNERNDFIAERLITRDFPWLMCIDSYSDHWYIQVRDKFIDRIIVLK